MDDRGCWVLISFPIVNSQIYFSFPLSNKNTLLSIDVDFASEPELVLRASSDVRRWNCREAAAQLNAPALRRHEVFTLRIYTNSTAQLLPIILLFTILEPSRTIRLLHYNTDSGFSLTEFFEGDIPKKYTILLYR